MKAPNIKSNDEALGLEIQFLRSPADSETPSLDDDPIISLLARAIISQQRAGFKDTADIRKFTCYRCKSAGFNTGWGFIAYVCGAEVLSDGEIDKACPADGGNGNG